jgi:hypothetical protein
MGPKPVARRHVRHPTFGPPSRAAPQSNTIDAPKSGLENKITEL